MENSQVTIALQAEGLRGPIGRPIVVLCEALDRNPQQLVCLRGSPGRIFETDRWDISPGPLSASEVEAVCTTVDQQIVTALLFWKGIQEEFHSLPGRLP